MVYKLNDFHLFNTIQEKSRYYVATETLNYKEFSFWS